MPSQQLFQSVDHYLQSLPVERREVLAKLRTTMHTSLPKGFKECINYNMIGYVVPHTLFPPGYHCDPSLPLPFINIASQKNHIGFYHLGLYADTTLFQWFIEAYEARYNQKLDRGKSCLRFKNLNAIPYGLLGELASKISVEQWISQYTQSGKGHL